MGVSQSTVSRVLSGVFTAVPITPETRERVLRAAEALRYRPHPLTLTRHRDGLVESLTRREIEVLGHMAEGHSNVRIARQLFISEATVKAHVKHILRKLDAVNRAEAISRYMGRSDTRSTV